jgi:murein DD-endopeptidase MepM/ murein hydrolase activator NlpD
MQDGDGVEDRSKIRMMIANIQDPNLKQEMTKVADSVLTKESSKDEEPKSNSLFGRLLTGLGSKIKSAFSFVLKPIGFLLKGIGKGLKAYWNWTKSVWASGVEDGKRGINTIKGGISDYRDAAAQSKARRQEAKQRVDARSLPVAEMEDISSVKKTGTDLGGKSESTTLAKIKKKLSTGVGYINDGLKWVRDKIKSATNTLVSGIKSIGEKIANSKFGQWASNAASTAVEKTKEVASKIVNSKAGRAVKGFGSDFAAGFSEARSEKKLAKLDKATPDTIADKESRTIREKLEEFMSKFFNGDNKFAKELRELIQKDTKAIEDLSPKMDDIADANEKGNDNLTNKSKGQHAEMDDLYAGKSGPKMESVDTKAKSGDLGKAKSSGGSSAKMADIKDGQNSKGKALGKIAAGGMDVASMIMKFIGPVIAGMAGIQAITELIQGALKDILKPLGKLFTKLFKVLQPVIEILKDALEPFIETVSNVLIDIVTPLAPVIQSIFECISPILDIVTVLLDAIMIPLMAIFDTIIVPSLELVTGCLKAIMGILQMGFGVLMTPLGAILAAIGKLPFPGLSSVGDKGKDLLTKGADMVTSGASMTVEGVKEAGLAALKLTGPGMIVNALMGDDSTAEEEEKTPESYQAKNADVTPGSAMDGLIGNGDIVNNYYYQNMYGSGNSTYNQNSYHNGMNMSQHGCGPIALADRANRMGGGINPYSLTQAMMANGNYSANAGTSVAGMISTGRALGMNLVPGGVTTDSLRGASPRNPITVIGSGMGFGTRSGANHYVNVVGTDSSGGAYVSNPMTGRVGRVRANELVANSALGLYGSGDNDVSYEEVFGEYVASAFGELSNIWSNISNIFNFKENETAAEKAQKGLDKEKNKRHIDNVKSKYSEDEWKAKYDEIAKENPKEDKESDEDYEYRINLEVSKALGQELSDKDSFKSFGEKTDEFGNSMNQFGSDFASSLAASNMFGESGGFYSASGNVKLATDGYTPEYTDTNMEESVNGHYIHSPIHEFFAKMGGLSWAESNNNWYKHYSDPHSKEGEGNSGDSHQGIDINLGGGVRGVTPVYATTDGILVIHQPEALAGGGGNYVEWTDNDGIHHRIMHLDHFSEEMENMRPGDPIIGGKTLLGYYGTTGQSTGDHIHYDISPNGYGSSEWYNPLTYFNFKPAATDGDSSYIAGDTLDEQMWQWLRFKGMKLPESSVAGIMGVWKAEGVQPRMIEGAYSEPETSLAEPIYDAIVGDPDNNTAGLQKLWDYTPEHAVGKNGGYLPNYMYNGHPWAGIGLAQWTAGRTYKLLKHAWDHGQRKWYELLPQLQYFEEELKTTHSKAGNELAGGEGHSPEEMAQMFWRDFEGFTWGSQADYDKRRNNARNVYDRFKGTSEINSTNFGTINSNADAYYAGYTDRNPGGGSSSSSSGGGKVWVGNMSFDSPEAANAYKNDKTRIYKDFYNNTLKKAYDKQSLDKRNYGGYPELLLKDYMRAILTPWSAYLDPDRNGVNGLYISHMDADKIFHLANGNNGSGIYSDIKKNGLYDLNEEKFKSAVYSSLISNNRSFAGIKSMLDNIDGMSGLPATQGGYATGTQPLKDHENMLYDYVLDKTIGRATPGFVRNNEFTVSGNLVDLKKSFNNLSYSSPVPIAFQSYVDIHGKDPTVKEFNKYYNGAPDGAMYRIPAIFKTSNKDYISAIRNAYGSGDEIANSIVDIPPIDYSKLPTDDWTDTIWNSMTNQQQQQTQYTQSQNTEVNDQIDRILANEYKTSDKRTHELLEKIYAYLEKKENEDGKPNPNSPDGTTPQGSQDMFEDKIPNSVYRLARG